MAKKRAKRQKRLQQEQASGKRPKKRRRKMNRAVLALIVVVGIGMLASVRNIVKLKLENNQLRKQNQQLQEKRDDLKEELKNVNSKEYIEEKAREQLRLVNPDEILFVFEDDESGSGED